VDLFNEKIKVWGCFFKALEGMQKAELFMTPQNPLGYRPVIYNT